MARNGIERTTLATRVLHELERMIVSEEWPEGTRIPAEPELMGTLGVSRNTVREAIRALAHLGLLEVRPGDGTYVRSSSVLASSMSRRLSGCSLVEALEARECLERQAVRFAAERRTEEDVRSLVQGYEQLNLDFAAGAPTEELIEGIWRQEKRLAKAAGSRLLGELFESIAEPVRDALRAVIDNVRGAEIDLKRPQTLNRNLLEAIETRDADAAEVLVSEKAQWIRTCLQVEGKTV